MPKCPKQSQSANKAAQKSHYAPFQKQRLNMKEQTYTFVIKVKVYKTKNVR